MSFVHHDRMFQKTKVLQGAGLRLEMGLSRQHALCALAALLACFSASLPAAGSGVLAKSWNLLSWLEPAPQVRHAVPVREIAWKTLIDSRGQALSSLPMVIAKFPAGGLGAEIHPSDMIVHFDRIPSSDLGCVAGSFTCPVPTLLSLELYTENKKKIKLAVLSLGAAPRDPVSFCIDLAGHNELRSRMAGALYLNWTPRGGFPSRPSELVLTRLRLTGNKRFDLLAGPAITTLTEDLGPHLLHSRALLIPAGKSIQLFLKGGPKAKIVLRGRSLGAGGARLDFLLKKPPGFARLDELSFGQSWWQEEIALSAFSGKSEEVRISNPSRATAALAAVYYQSGDQPLPRSAALLIFDALRRDALGTYGYPLETSPRIDAFARGHVVFDRALTAGPQTAWSVLHMLSSNWGPFELNEGQKVPDACNLLPGDIQRQGFITAGISQNINSASVHGLIKGYDLFLEQNCKSDPLDVAEHQRSASLAADALTDLMPLLSRSGFFLYIHVLKPHFPYIPSDEGYAPFAFDYKGAIRAGTVADEPNVLYKWEKLAAGDRRQLRALYDGCIRDCDIAFAAIMKKMRAGKLLDRTLLVLSADHGELFGEHAGYRIFNDSEVCAGVLHPRFLFQPIIAVPFIIAFPGDRALRISKPVSSIDIFPTIAAYLGAVPGSTLQGRSLLPLVAGKTWPERRLFTTFRNAQHMAVACCSDNRKTVRYFLRRQEQWVPDRGATYDISDFSKDREIQASASAVKNAFREIDDFLEKQLPMIGRLGMAEASGLTEEQTRKLRSLGYL